MFQLFYLISVVIGNPKPPLKAQLTSVNKLFVGQEKSILTLQDYGVAVSAELEYKRDYKGLTPCRFQSQQIRFMESSYAHLIDQFTEKQFKQNFLEGHFYGHIPQIIGFEQIPNGLAVLTSESMLYTVDISKNVRGKLITRKLSEVNLTEFLSDNLHPESKCILLYEHLEGQLVILTNKMHLIAVVKNTQIENVFQLKSDLQVKNTRGIVRLDSSVCAIHDQGFSCYNLIKTFTYQLDIAYQDDVENATDIRIFKNSKNNYTIFVLNQQQGILVYKAYENQNLQMVYERVNTSPIGRGGTGFDIFGNTIMIIRKTLQIYQVFDYHFNIEDYTWIELNHWNFAGEITDIDVTDGFAIVTGKSGHHVLFHSIHHKFYSASELSQSDFYMPNLIGLDFYLKDTQPFRSSFHGTNLIIGATRHQVFAVEYMWQPMHILCHTDDTQIIGFSPIQMTLLLYSTQCPAKKDKNDDLTVCQTSFDLKVYFRKSIINRGWLMIIVGIAGAIALSIMVTCFCLLAKFVLFRNKSNVINQQLEEWAKQGYKIDSIELPNEKSGELKYASVPGDSKSRSPNVEPEMN